MKLSFVKCSPTQNMTIFIETQVPRENHTEVAEKLLAYESVYAEQLGYIETATNKTAEARLQMMAGEFCGNAVVALSAYLVWTQDRPAATPETVFLETSGTDEILKCTVTRRGENVFDATAQMPLPEGIGPMVLPVGNEQKEFTAVRIPGITHIIVPIEMAGDDPKAFALEAVERWEPLIDTDAYGIMLLDEEKLYMDPLVRVASVNSLVWERGCGSGTAAVGAYLAHKAQGDISTGIAQPGGVITVDVSLADGAFTYLQIGGKVTMNARGTAFTED